MSFAWTDARLTLVFEGLDRSRPWTLRLRAKAGRGPGLPLPTATIGTDGATLATASIGPQWQDVSATIPTDTRSRPTRIVIDVAPTFVPGPGDARTLGMIVDDVRLTPDGMPAAPGRALTAAAIAGAIVAAFIVVAGVPASWALALTLGFALAQALALSTGAAPYARAYLGVVPEVAGGAGLMVALIAGGAALVQRRPLSPTAGLAVAIVAVALVLGLEGLLHPGKAVVDAIFHAHRLDTVLAGNYFFTQPVGSGVAFPYAIGLYVMAAPWAGLTRDHVLLLRIVVAIVHVLAALSLYPLVRSRWPAPVDRRRRRRRLPAGAAAVRRHRQRQPDLRVRPVDRHDRPGVGDDVAARTGAGRVAAAGLVALLSLGLLSHVGLIPLLGGLVGASAVLLAWRGDGEDRLAGWVILGATLDRHDPGGRALLPALRRRVPLGAAGRPELRGFGRRRGRAGRVRPVELRQPARPGRSGRRGRCGPDAPPVWRSRPTARRSSCSRSSASPGCRSAPDGTAPP